MEYLVDNKILNRYQSGFRDNHLTVTCFLYLRDKILIGFDCSLLSGMIIIFRIVSLQMSYVHFLSSEIIDIFWKMKITLFVTFRWSIWVF